MGLYVAGGSGVCDRSSLQGTAFVDISEPANAEVVDVIPGPETFWRDVKVYQTYAYVAGEVSGGIQVIDLSEIDEGDILWINSVTAGGNQQTHNLASDATSKYLYRLAGDHGTAGLGIYELTDPTAPALVAEWHERYVHDDQVVTYDDGPYAGRQIAFCFANNDDDGGNPGVEVLDVTDKSNIARVSFFSYPNALFSHQGWLSPDQRHLYFSDEKLLPAPTFVADVSDIDDPFVVGSFDSADENFGHNLYTRGSLVFEANYDTGFRVFDASDPVAPTEAAFFDTVPDANGTRRGLWSIYPFFANEKIVVGTDLEFGLFVWWVGEPQLTFAYPEQEAGRPIVLSAGVPLRVEVTEETVGLLDQTSVTLHVDTGNGFEPVPIPHVFESTFEGALPGICDQRSIEYYVSAETSDGINWRNPATTPVEATVEIVDCNVNRVEAACDIGDSVVGDCESNGIPDVCDIAQDPTADCDENGSIDACDISSELVPDCDRNGVPDACDLGDPTVDIDRNGTLDVCQEPPPADCNANGEGDVLKIAAGTVSDCNAGIPDECEIASGELTDEDQNGVPDRCDAAVVRFQRGGQRCVKS